MGSGLRGVESGQRGMGSGFRGVESGPWRGVKVRGLLKLSTRISTLDDRSSVRRVGQLGFSG